MRYRRYNNIYRIEVSTEDAIEEDIKNLYDLISKMLNEANVLLRRDISRPDWDGLLALSAILSYN